MLLFLQKLESFGGNFLPDLYLCFNVNVLTSLKEGWYKIEGLEVAVVDYPNFA